MLLLFPFLRSRSSHPEGRRAGENTHPSKFTGIGLINFVFTGVVRPVWIVAEHGGGNAEAKENIVVAALCVRNCFRYPVVARTGLSVEVGFARLRHYVSQKAIEE